LFGLVHEVVDRLYVALIMIMMTVFGIMPVMTTVVIVTTHTVRRLNSFYILVFICGGQNLFEVYGC
jgi:uncharacterized membrane protein